MAACSPHRSQVNIIHKDIFLDAAHLKSNIFRDAAGRIYSVLFFASFCPDSEILSPNNSSSVYPTFYSISLCFCSQTKPASKGDSRTLGSAGPHRAARPERHWFTGAGYHASLQAGAPPLWQKHSLQPQSQWPRPQEPARCTQWYRCLLCVLSMLNRSCLTLHTQSQSNSKKKNACCDCRAEAAGSAAGARESDCSGFVLVWRLYEYLTVLFTVWERRLCSCSQWGLTVFVFFKEQAGICPRVGVWEQQTGGVGHQP